MNKIYYYLNLLVAPVYFVIVFAMNWWKLTKQAFQWSVAETKSAYQGNRRYFGVDK